MAEFTSYENERMKLSSDVTLVVQQEQSYQFTVLYPKYSFTKLNAKQ